MEIKLLSNKFYSLIPHAIGTTVDKLKNAYLDTIERVEEKRDLLQLMRDMTKFVKKMNQHGEKVERTTLMYQSLKTSIQLVDETTADYKSVIGLIENEHGDILFNKNQKIRVNRIYKIRRENEVKNFSDTIFNVNLLFHGSKIDNWLGILSRGILMPKAIVQLGIQRTDAGLLGHGIYFAQLPSASVQYTTPSSKNTRLLAVCSVALGNVRNLTQADSTITAPPINFHSCHGIQSTDYLKTDFKDSEYAVYNVNQQKLEYLIEFELIRYKHVPQNIPKSSQTLPSTQTPSQDLPSAELSQEAPQSRVAVKLERRISDKFLPKGLLPNPCPRDSLSSLPLIENASRMATMLKGKIEPPQRAPQESALIHYLTNSEWLRLLKEEFSRLYFNELSQFLEKERQSFTIYPEMRNVFAALNECSYSKVKVVILGQDPYHNGAADGLAFSSTSIPVSLANIFTELKADIPGFVPPTSSGKLNQWCKEGVLLLNTTLTVRKGIPNSHVDSSWKTFTDKVLEHLNNHPNPIVFLLWGKFAQEKSRIISNNKHKVLMAPHPSPFSASTGFFGCKHFSQANQFLQQSGRGPVNWHLVEPSKVPIPAKAQPLPGFDGMQIDHDVSNSNKFTLLNDLNPVTHNWDVAIFVKITFKSAISFFNSKKGKSYFFYIEFIDEAGSQMKASGFSVAVTAHYNSFEEDKVPISFFLSFIYFPPPIPL